MLRKLRIAVLLYVLVFLAAGHYLTQQRSRSWNTPLWIDVYPVRADASAGTAGYVGALDAESFTAIEAFFAAEAERFELDTARPFRFSVADPLARPPPEPPRDPGMLDTLAWSLRLRWHTARLVWTSDRPRPDIVVYAVYHGTDRGHVLDASRALEKGMIVVSNLFADRAAGPTNDVVIAHELLHTVGASDKYDPVTTLPEYPAGYAAPDARPRLPQHSAELMGGRVPVASDAARMPAGLDEVVIGPVTAAEIGWTRAAE